MARLPSVVLTRVYKFFLAFAGLSLWKRDANGDYTQASADASPQLLADDNVSSMTSMPVGSLLVDPVNGRLYIANSSGTPKLVPQAGSNATFNNNVVLYFGDGNDIGVTWDATDLIVSQAAADSNIKLGVSGAGINVIFYGDTAGYNMTWDQSNDQLLFADSAKLGIGSGAGAAADITVSWDGTRLNVNQLTADSEIRWGIDGAGLDQRWYGDTASAFMLWDQSLDTLSFGGTAKLGVTNRSIGASTAAAGSATGDAGVLPAGTAPVYPTTAADGTKGVRINAADQVTGRTVFIGNGVGNQILKVYAPSGGNINGLGADAAFSSASGKGVIITCLDSAGNTWLAW